MQERVVTSSSTGYPGHKISIESVKRISSLFFILVSYVLGGCQSLPVQPAETQISSTPTETEQSTLQPASLPSAIPTQSVTPDVQIFPTASEQPTEAQPAATTVPSTTPELTAGISANKQSSIFSSDLLYLSVDRLMRWDPKTHFAVPLTEKVRSFSVDSLGEVIALRRPKQISANGSELFDLDILLLETMQIKPLKTGYPNLEQISVSPDGMWVAYYSSDREGGISVQNITAADIILPIGNCVRQNSTDCQEFSWSPNSRELLWIDSRGVWKADISKQSANLVSTKSVRIKDPQGESFQVEVELHAPRWSPAGRFVLLEVFPRDSQVHWEAVLDTATGRISQMTDTYESPEMRVNLAWLSDGSIITAQSSNPIDNKPAVLRHWQLIPTNENMLVPFQLIQLPPADLFGKMKLENLTIDPSDRLQIDSIQQISSSTVCFGARLIEKTDTTVFFVLQLDNKKIEPIIQVSETIDQIYWAPNGSGFLIAAKQTGYFYIDLQELDIVKINITLDDSASSFQWMPLAIHP